MRVVLAKQCRQISGRIQSKTSLLYQVRTVSHTTTTESASVSRTSGDPNTLSSHGFACGCGKCGGKPISERHLTSAAAATNRGVIFMGPNHVEVKGTN